MVRQAALALLLLVIMSAPAGAQTETVEYYGLDALGSVRVIFDAQGNVVDRMDYGPFGENLRAAIKFPVEQFAQLARDAESGQDYAQARNYSASTGRFNRVDPVYAGLFDPQAWNRYAYALNSPVVFLDASGLNAESFTSTSVPGCETFNCDFQLRMQVAWYGGWGGWGGASGFVGGSSEPAGSGGYSPPTTPPGTPPGTPPETPPGAPPPPGTPPDETPDPGLMDQVVNNLRCAATASQTISLAEVSGYGDSSIVQVFGGNDIASLTTMLLGPDHLAGGRDLAAGRVAQMGARGGMHYRFMQERIPLRATSSGGYESIRFLDGSLARTPLGAKVLAGAAKASLIKMAYDAVTFVGSAAFCAGF
jgi:RHS repeat-associated protein